MKYILLLYLIIYSSILIHAQDTLREFYANGQIKSEYPRLKNGKWHGLCRKWHENGQLEQIDFMDSGYVNGKCVNWYASGKLEMIRFHKKGHIIEWHTWTEKGIKTGMFKTTFRTKKVLLWYNNGKKMRVEKFRNGYPLDYFEKDTLLYVDLYRKSNSNNKHRIKHLYTNYNGKILEWDENGILTKEEYYKKGKLVKRLIP